MSKNNKNEPNEIVGPAWPGGYLIEESQLKYLEGRILTHIEVLGLEAKQEEAFKSLLRQELWNFFYQGTLWVTSDQHTELRVKNNGLGQSINPRPI